MSYLSKFSLKRSKEGRKKGEGRKWRRDKGKRRKKRKGKRKVQVWNMESVLSCAPMSKPHICAVGPRECSYREAQQAFVILLASPWQQQQEALVREGVAVGSGLEVGEEGVPHGWQLQRSPGAGLTQPHRWGISFGLFLICGKIKILQYTFHLKEDEDTLSCFQEISCNYS